MLSKKIKELINKLGLTFGDGIIIATVVFIIYHYWYKISSYFNMMGF